MRSASSLTELMTDARKRKATRLPQRDRFDPWVVISNEFHPAEEQPTASGLRISVPTCDKRPERLRDINWAEEQVTSFQMNQSNFKLHDDHHTCTTSACVRNVFLRQCLYGSVSHIHALLNSSVERWAQFSSRTMN